MAEGRGTNFLGVLYLFKESSQYRKGNYSAPEFLSNYIFLDRDFAVYQSKDSGGSILFSRGKKLHSSHSRSRPDRNFRESLLKGIFYLFSPQFFCCFPRSFINIYPLKQ